MSERTLSDGATVRDAVASAGLTVGNREIRVGGRPASLDTVLREGDTVILAAQVKGNC
jgi:putative ubiquitin-RnfH superfamily antitoxin RatB of RatAB toxin-antitoxin module